MPWRVMRNVGQPSVSKPRTRTVPLRGGTMPSMLLMSVVLPMPLRPIRPTASPSRTAKSTPWSTWLAP
jgi:hypothetical protein